MRSTPKTQTIDDSNKTDLLKILDEAMTLVALPNNDFVWSRWDGAEEAITALMKHREAIAHNDLSHLRELIIIFLPTGSLQEVSISSGWGQTYLDLAARFDQVINSLT